MAIRSFTHRYISTLKPEATRRDIAEPGRTGLWVRVGPSGRKIWVYRYRANSRIRRLRLGEFPAMSLAGARIALAQAKATVENGGDPAEQAAEAAAIERSAGTVKETIDLYLRSDWVERLRSKAEVERALRRDVAGAWGARKTKDISRTDIRRLLQSKADNGAGVMANRLQAYIHRLFEFAVDEEIVAFNPAAGLRRRRKEESRDRVLTSDEVRMFWIGLDRCSFNAGIKRVLRLMLVTAQRKAEIVGMKKSEFDLKERIWEIPRDRSKNGQMHIVPLSDLAIGILRSGISESDGDYVFQSGSRHSKSAHLTASAINRALRMNQDRFDCMAFTPHDLRRTAATHLGRLGTPRFIQDRILNHADNAIGGVYDRYGYLGEKRAALELWEREIRNIIGDSEPIPARLTLIKSQDV